MDVIVTEGDVNLNKCKVAVSLRQEQAGVLEGGAARFSRMLEAGLKLQEAGCRGVGVATSQLEARWRVLHRRVKQESSDVERKRKLRNR